MSAESAEENEPPAKRSKVNGIETTTVSTKEQDGDSGAAAKRKRKGELIQCHASSQLLGTTLRPGKRDIRPVVVPKQLTRESADTLY